VYASFFAGSLKGEKRMAKGQQRKNKETKKPKQEKKPA
jgi:hypothetical protein